MTCPALTPAVKQARVVQLAAALKTHLQCIEDENWAKN
jgi:hypothetical protein